METRNAILLSLFALAVVLIIDYILISIMGCFSSACGAESGFFCTIFCKIVPIVVALSIMIPVLISEISFL